MRMSRQFSCQCDTQCPRSLRVASKIKSKISLHRSPTMQLGKDCAWQAFLSEGLGPFKLFASAVFASSLGRFSALHAWPTLRIIRNNWEAAKYRNNEHLMPLNKTYECSDHRTRPNNPLLWIHQGIVNKLLLYFMAISASIRLQKQDNINIHTICWLLLDFTGCDVFFPGLTQPPFPVLPSTVVLGLLFRGVLVEMQHRQLSPAKTKITQWMSVLESNISMETYLAFNSDGE